MYVLENLHLKKAATMKHNLFAAMICFLLGFQNLSAAMDISFKPFAGYTIVDVEKAMETTLETWDQFNYGAYLQGLWEFKPAIKLGIETGINRLYYWEEAYTVYYPGAVQRWRWGEIWTWNLSAAVQKELVWSSDWYVQGTAGLYTFLNGSGITPGFSAGCGHAWRISESVKLPVETRLDFIFGNALPITLKLIIGISGRITGLP
jgi:hypothetical protein